MAVKVRVKTSRAGINRLVRSEFMQREIDRRADNVAHLAQQLAPVRTGTYRASIHRRSSTRATGAYAQVVASATYSVYVEFGNSRGAPRQRVMVRALYAARD